MDGGICLGCHAIERIAADRVRRAGGPMHHRRAIAVAAASSRTRPARRSTSVPSGPSASTRALATMTPAAPALAIAPTWAALLTPNPTATGTGDAAVTSRINRPTVGGRLVRAPVTPTSDTQ